MKHITRTVWILSLISLFTDTASEMLYPIMPVYLKSIGYSVFFIGLLEGLAEAVAGLSKGYFGKLSDASAKRVPFVRIGYALSALSKPVMGFLVAPVWIFFARTLDRLGKGIRTGARDAILSAEATPQTKGRVFGFHRSMDTIGAVAGPLLALGYLYFYPQNYQVLFLIAFVPGIMAIVASLILRESTTAMVRVHTKVGFFSFASYWNHSSSGYKKLVVGLLAFAVFNSSDVFLLLKIKEAGVNDSTVIMMYVFYNLVYALSSYPLGVLADKIGLKKVLTIGLCLFVIVYFGMAFNQSIIGFVLLFIGYGLYAAATEGIAKAWITNSCEFKDTATAVGFYTGWQSICALVASTLAGIIWHFGGSIYTFLLTASASLIISIYFWWMVPFVEKGDLK